MRAIFMDPKTLSNLDPKLRETYEKVMGAPSQAKSDSSPTPTSEPAGTTPATPPAPNTSPADSSIPPIPQPTQTNEQSPQPTEPKPESPEKPTTTDENKPEKTTELQSSLTGTPVSEPKNSMGTTEGANKPLQPLPSPASVNQQTQEGAAKPPSTILKVLYIVAGVIFFIAYGIFWMKIFNFPLPF